MDGMNLQKQTFINADEKTQKAMMFDLLQSIYERFDKHLETCDKRHECIRKDKQRTLAYSIMAGGIGGTLAGMLKTLWSLFK